MMEKAPDLHHKLMKELNMGTAKDAFEMNVYKAKGRL